MARDDDYAVGYWRPPLRTRFKPGSSGNPKGRPMRTNQELEYGPHGGARGAHPPPGRSREYRVSKQRAVLKSLVAQAAKGNTRATVSLVTLCARVFGVTDEEGGDRPLSAPGQRVIDEFVEREIARRELDRRKPAKLERKSKEEA